MAERAVRASLAGEAAGANVWEAEKRELPCIALPRLCLSFVCTRHLVSFLQQRIRKLASENQSHLPKVTQPGLERNPELPGPHCPPGGRAVWRCAGSGPSAASA